MKETMNLDYTFFCYGNNDAAYLIEDVLAWKDYKTFMKLYRSPDNGIDYLLPAEALVWKDGSCTGETRDITLKQNFDQINRFECKYC